MRRATCWCWRTARPLSRADPEVFETALEIFDSAAEYWYDEEVPFWVFVAGADPEQFDLPPLGQE